MNKNVDEILCELCDLVENASKEATVLSVFYQAFNERDEVELLKKRALLLEDCERVAKELEYEDDFFEEIFKAICFKNLDYPAKHLESYLTKAHRRQIVSTFKHYKSIKKEHEVDDIVELSDELKSDIENEDLTEPQKALMYEICEAVENAKQEHDIVGNSAIKKLREILRGKLFLYKDEITSIKSEVIKEKLFKVYKKVEEVNKIMGFIISLKNNVNTILNLFN